MGRIPTRRLLSEAMSRHHPGFEAVDGPTGLYSFREQARGDWLRDTEPGEHVLNHVVVFGHSMKERCFGVDVYAGLLPSWNTQYGRHLLASSMQLANLRLGSTSIPAEESVYLHDGTEAGAAATLERIAGELRAHALPWFQLTETRARNDVLAAHARTWLLRYWPEIADDVSDKAADAIQRSNHRAWEVDFPLLQSLKDELRHVASAHDLPFEHRQEISTLAFQLLEYAQHRKRAAG